MISTHRVYSRYLLLRHLSLAHFSLMTLARPFAQPPSPTTPNKYSLSRHHPSSTAFHTRSPSHLQPILPHYTPNPTQPQPANLSTLPSTSHYLTSPPPQSHNTPANGATQPKCHTMPPLLYDTRHRCWQKAFRTLHPQQTCPSKQTKSVYTVLTLRTLKRSFFPSLPRFGREGIVNVEVSAQEYITPFSCLSSFHLWSRK